MAEYKVGYWNLAALIKAQEEQILASGRSVAKADSIIGKYLRELERMDSQMMKDLESIGNTNPYLKYAVRQPLDMQGPQTVRRTSSVQWSVDVTASRTNYTDMGVMPGQTVQYTTITNRFYPYANKWIINDATLDFAASFINIYTHMVKRIWQWLNKIDIGVYKYAILAGSTIVSVKSYNTSTSTPFLTEFGNIATTATTASGATADTVSTALKVEAGGRLGVLALYALVSKIMVNNKQIKLLPYSTTDANGLTTVIQPGEPGYQLTTSTITARINDVDGYYDVLVSRDTWLSLFAHDEYFIKYAAETGNINVVEAKDGSKIVLKLLRIIDVGDGFYVKPYATTSNGNVSAVWEPELNTRTEVEGALVFSSQALWEIRRSQPKVDFWARGYHPDDDMKKFSKIVASTELGVSVTHPAGIIVVLHTPTNQYGISAASNTIIDKNNGGSYQIVRAEIAEKAGWYKALDVNSNITGTNPLGTDQTLAGTATKT